MIDFLGQVKLFPLEEYFDNHCIDYQERHHYYLLDKCLSCYREEKMIVNKEEKFFRCFVCGVHGSLLDFIIHVEQIPRKEAYEIIVGRKIYINEQILKSNLENAPIESIDDLVMRELVPIGLPISFAHIDFDNGSIATEYLESRGIDQGLIDDFWISYDSYQKRICFPIHDHLARVVGWQARDVTGEQKPKILTKPFGFKKSLVLYRWNRAQHHDSVTLVEGPVDAIKCYQRNGVAMFGKHLSDQQLALLMSNPDLRTVNLGLDPDAISETLNLASLLSCFYRVRIVELPEDREDLGECSVEEANEAIDTSPEFSDYKKTLVSNLN